MPLRPKPRGAYGLVLGQIVKFPRNVAFVPKVEGWLANCPCLPNVALERWMTPLRTANRRIFPPRSSRKSSGRLRLDVPGALCDPVVARRAREALESIPGVRKAEINLHSGRALVLLDAPLRDSSPAESVAELQKAISRVVPPKAPPPPSLRGLFREGEKAVDHFFERRRLKAQKNGSLTEARPWHADSIEEVARALETSSETGLGLSAAASLLRQFGPNLLTGIPRRTRWNILAGQVFTLPTALLGGAMGLSLLLGDVFEAGAILVVVGSNIAVGYFTEARAEELLHAFRELRADQATVIRGGVEMAVDASELVPGDLMIVRAGELIAADARLVEIDDEFSVDESTLTGESTPVEKGLAKVPKETSLADRSGMIYAATSVATGSAKAIVVATGSMTEVGAIERALSQSNQRAAPLEEQLGKLGRTLAGLSLASSAAIVALGLLRGQPIPMLARSAVALGVAAIPEGVPAVGTTALVLASYRLRRNGIVIRRLAAAETLGAVSVVCADKTGTLTENRMRVAELYLPGHGPVKVEWSDDLASMRLVGERAKELSIDAVHDLARIAALNADVDVSDAGEVVEGSGTEQALVEFAMAAGYPVLKRRRQARRVDEQRRSAEVPIMVTVHDHPELGMIELAKGAPEQIIERCNSLSEPEKAAILRENDVMASHGLRVLAFAWRRDGRQGSTAKLAFAGLIALRDPPRQGAKEALATFARAGIETQMLTGDQARTAAAIAKELGISPELVRSRVTSTDKLTIVKALQDEGRLVAMTGDGVNDGPALQAADVGIAMGMRGTSIARAVADVVLETDDLPSLALAVKEGRTLYDNVRRAIAFLVATNMSEVGTMLFGSVFGVYPLSPLQLLWLNLLTDVAPALVLAAELGEPDVMDRSPRDPHGNIFSRQEYRRLGAQSAAMAAAALASYGVGASRRRAGAYASTMAFTSLMTAQLLHTRNCRSDAPGAHKNLDMVLAGSFALQGLALAAPPVRSFLGNTPLGLMDLGIAIGLGVLPSIRTKASAHQKLEYATDEIVISRREPLFASPTMAEE